MTRRGRAFKDLDVEKKLSRLDKFRIRMGAKIIGGAINKTATVQPSFVFEPLPVIRHPDFDYINLFEVATTSWPLRRVFRAIIQECTRNRWSRVAKFTMKCSKCGKEFDFIPPAKEGAESVCDSCGASLLKPDETQARLFDQLLDRPNRDYHFDDLVRSSLFYDLALDDWYWSISYKRKPKSKDGKILLQNGYPVMVKEAKEIYIEDSRFMFPVADKYGHLGGYEWFCPECYGVQSGTDFPVVTIQPEETLLEQEKKKFCPLCKGPMIQTCYVEEVNGIVLARFGLDEIVHGSSSRVLPSLFGNSKIVSVWKIVQTVLSMDDYNFEVYSEGKVGKILGFPGYDQTEIDVMKKAIEEELQRLDKKDIQTGRFATSKKIRTLMLGLKKDQEYLSIPVMEDLVKMQSSDFYRLYLDAIAGVYGVTPDFVSVTTPGGGSRLIIDVQNRTTIEHQSNFADLFNSDILPKFGITDWVLAFDPIEGRDTLREMQVEHTKAAAAFTWLRGGFTVSLGPGGNLVITGIGKLPEVSPEGSRAGEQPRSMEGKPQLGNVAPTQLHGEQLQLSANLPVSWFSVSQVRLWDRVFALNNEQNEVYVVVDGKEVTGTRTSTTNFSYAVASLLKNILDFVETKLEDVEGFNKEDFEEGEKLLADVKREFDPDQLITLASYFDKINMPWLAEKIDSLRIRLGQIKINPIEEFAVAGGNEEPQITPEEKLLAKTRAPFGVVMEEQGLAESLKRILGWAKDQMKLGKKKERVIHEAKVKAEMTIEKSYQDLMHVAYDHARRRTKKRITLSPKELVRIERFKADSLRDFEKILREGL